MCVDYRQLNTRTIKDASPFPMVEEILDNSYFSVLDVKSAWIPSSKTKRRIQRPAFTVGPLGFFKYNQLLFGLANAPASYQWLMENCIADLDLKIRSSILRILLYFRKHILEEHADRLKQVFHYHRKQFEVLT